MSVISVKVQAPSGRTNFAAIGASGTVYQVDSNGYTVVTNSDDLNALIAAGFLFTVGGGGSSGHALYSALNGLTAKAGGGQAGATLCAADINRFTTVGTAADSGLMPTAVPGMSITVINAAAANSMNLFPAVGDAINALGANAAYAIAANKAATLYCAVAGFWQADVSA